MQWITQSKSFETKEINSYKIEALNLHHRYIPYETTSHKE